ncbi:MAG TPA: hypothetical protein VMA95_08670 [Streptosporangiaceae bacterium]|nr:hypothetical protein [Streptosporangiaceae bacterium]
MTGSVVLTVTRRAKPAVTKCYLGRQQYKDTDVQYEATYASPAGHSLQATSYLLGKAKLAAKGSGGFDFSTFRKI